MAWAPVAGFVDFIGKSMSQQKSTSTFRSLLQEMNVRDPFLVVAGTSIQSKLMDSKLYIDFAIVGSMNLFVSSKDERGGRRRNHHPHAILRSGQPGATSCDSTGLSGKSSGHWLADMIPLPPHYFLIFVKFWKRSSMRCVARLQTSLKML